MNFWHKRANQVVVCMIPGFPFILIGKVIRDFEDAFAVSFGKALIVNFFKKNGRNISLKRKFQCLF